MPSTFDIAVLVGSLRRESYTLRYVQALQKIAPAALKLEVVPIGGLPFYNQDLEEAGAPQPWVDFRARIRAADAVLFATPEYNRSIPAALKNAIDVGSRPYGQSVFSGKPAAVISTSPGAVGGFGAHHHLRQPLVFLDMPVLQQPEMYVGGVDKLVDANGFTTDGAKQFGAKFLGAFEGWLKRLAAG